MQNPNVQEARIEHLEKLWKTGQERMDVALSAIRGGRKLTRDDASDAYLVLHEITGLLQWLTKRDDPPVESPREAYRTRLQKAFEGFIKDYVDEMKPSDDVLGGDTVEFEMSFEHQEEVWSSDKQEIVVPLALLEMEPEIVQMFADEIAHNNEEWELFSPSISDSEYLSSDITVSRVEDGDEHAADGE